MKLRSLLVIQMLPCLGVVACHTTQPVRREALVGTYTYVSKDPDTRATDHNLSRLVLEPDGKYDLTEGGTTKAVEEKKGAWTTEPGDPPNVVLDHAGYPIEIERNEVRLLIDLDTGIWWVKPR